MSKIEECISCKNYKNEDEVSYHHEIYNSSGECYEYKAVCVDCHNKQLFEEEIYIRLVELKQEKRKDGKVLNYEEFCKKLDLDLGQDELLRQYERFYLNLD